MKQTITSDFWGYAKYELRVCFKIPTCEEKTTKIKLQMNEHEISTHVKQQFTTSNCTA